MSTSARKVMPCYMTNIDELAMAVSHSDQFNSRAGTAEVAHILEIALKNRLALSALGRPNVHVDLGNGHVLICTVSKKAG